MEPIAVIDNGIRHQRGASFTPFENIDS